MTATKMPDNFLIYGSYGYTGNLTVGIAVEQGMTPILAGRNPQKLERQAASFARPLEYHAFDLTDREALERALDGVAVVLHIAGPFSRTHRHMADACIRTGTHYLDISGEVPVYESLWRMDEAAKTAGVMLLPGIGFDVVPTDCLAARLRSELPEATRLTLAIGSDGRQRSAVARPRHFSKASDDRGSSGETANSQTSDIWRLAERSILVADPSKHTVS